MGKAVPKIILAVLLFSIFYFLFSIPVHAACTPPSDYSSCPLAPIGTNGVPVLNDDLVPSPDGLVQARKLFGVNRPYRFPVVVYIGKDTLTNTNEISQILKTAKDQGIDLAIRIWENEMSPAEAAEMGQSVSQAIERVGGPAPMIGWNEPNKWDDPNTQINALQFAQIYNAFASNCHGCRVALPSLGGPPTAEVKANKEAWVAAFSQALSSAAWANTKVIYFNSYDETGGLTDWLTTSLPAWTQRIDTSNLDYFLTEVGVPEGKLNTAVFETLVSQYNNFLKDPNFAAQMKKVKGFAIFAWTDDEELIMVLIDPVTGKIIKTELVGYIVVKTAGSQPTGRRSPTRAPTTADEEWEEACFQEEVPKTFSSEAPTYRKRDGRSQPQMREDAGLNFNAAVRGAHCGQTKSQSVILREESPFDPDEGRICKTVRWAGEIQINYDHRENFLIPFAKEIADHWAGTLDAEHMKEEEIDRLYALAYPDFSPFDRGDVLQRKVRDAASASAEIRKRQGVLKYLLPKEKQDELKCSFIRYVQQKGNISAYNNFTIEGTALKKIPCPPTIDNPRATQEEYQTWQRNWGSKWEKMGLFPNEKSLGMLRFAVCEDRIYDLGIGYPEVFRLGLAANELFKIFTPKEGQERYYRANNDQNNLKQPLDKNRVLAYGQRETTPSNTSAPLGVGESISRVPKQVPNLYPTNSGSQLIHDFVEARKVADSSFLGIVDKTSSFLKNLLPTIKSAFAMNQTVHGFAQTMENLNPFKNRKLLAQAPPESFHLEVSSDANGNVTVKFVSDGCDGDIRLDRDGHMVAGINGWNIETGPFVYGPQYTGPPIQVAAGQCTSVTYTGTIVRGPRNCGNQTSSVSCNFCRDAEGTLSTDCGVSPPPPPPGGPPQPSPCDPAVACCPTGDSCQPTCKLCQIAQKGPSDTTVWPKDYPANHILLGVSWPGGGLKVDDETKVPLTWEIPEWDGTVKNLPPGCTFTPCAPGDKECQTNYYCPSDVGQCGKIACVKVHDRVVNVYNNVPFLASIWKQVADPGGAPETSCYRNCLNQGNPSSQCRSACAIPGGFLNIFKPYCDPRNPQSICNQAARQTANFIGCTTNERHVFDRSGNFRPNPAYSEVTYSFDQGFGVGAERQQYDFGRDEVRVTQISPRPREKAKVTFYRLGGLCNVNSWVSQKELNPWKPEEVSPFYRGGMITPTTGPCAGRTIDPDKLYHIETCEEAEPEPACCAKMGQGKYAQECVWEDRWWCRRESCDLIPGDKARCGAGIDTFYRTGRELAQ